MRLTYLGHSCWLVESGGTRLLIDPYDNSVGYPMDPVASDAVFVSHEHFDHNFVARASGSPAVIRGLEAGGAAWATVDERVGPFRLRTVHAFHDDTRGTKRGRNAVLVLEADDLMLAHLGDLGHVLSEQQAAAVGAPDLALVPIGGYYTIDAGEAWQVVGQLAPRVVIPMHYKTAVNDGWPISSLDPFLRRAERVQRKGHSVEVTRAALPQQMEVWVMDHA